MWKCGSQGRRETHTRFWWENLQEKTPFTTYWHKFWDIIKMS